MVLNQQKSGSHNIDYNKINFFDCLHDYFRSTTLDIDNLRRCEYCHKENHSIIQYRMKTLPRILVIQMKRFDQFERKLANNVQFPFTFSFDKNYLNGELADKEINGYQQEVPYFPKTMNPLLPRLDNPTIKRRHTYELYAMIIHHGYSARRGHYYSLIKHGNTGKWIKFDDEKITLIEHSDKLALLMQKAYILFYEKKWIFEDQPAPPIRKSTRLNHEDDQQMLPKTGTATSKKVTINVQLNKSTTRNQKDNKETKGSVSQQMQRDLESFTQKKSAGSTVLAKRKAKISTEALAKKIKQSPSQRQAASASKRARISPVAQPKTGKSKVIARKASPKTRATPTKRSATPKKQRTLSTVSPSRNAKRTTGR